MDKWFRFPVIFVVLGLGAAVWIAAATDFHVLDRAVSQERRAAQAVGEMTPPIAPIKLTIKPGVHRSCLQVERARVDDSLTVYVRRICGHGGDYDEAHWKAIAADGTVIQSGYTNYQVDQVDIGELAEWNIGTYSYSPDPRTVEISFWTGGR